MGDKPPRYTIHAILKHEKMLPTWPDGGCERGIIEANVFLRWVVVPAAADITRTPYGQSLMRLPAECYKKG